MLCRFHLPPPPPTSLTVQRERESLPATISWNAPTQEMIEGYGNIKDATEDGACALAIAAVYATDRFIVKRRLQQGSGADFMMVKEGEADESFTKLEVSGMATLHSAQTRLRQKIAQVSSGTVQRPGVAVVVKFPNPLITMRRS